MKQITFAMALAITLLCSTSSFSQMARMQAIHNSPDAALAVIDVYLGDIRIIDNIGYKVATPFLDAPAGVPLTFTVAPGNSASVADGVYSTTVTLESGLAYIFTANGIHSSTGYTPAPPFELRLFTGAFENGFQEGVTSILVNHGCTDSGNVNVSETGVPLGLFIYDMPYPMFTNGYHMMPTMDYVIEVTSTADNSVLGSYSAPLATLGMSNQAAVVLSSGFVNPEANSNGPEFGLYMVLPQGGYFIPLQSTLSTESIANSSIAVYPNPASESITLQLPFSYSTLNLNVNDQAGRPVLQQKNSAKLDVSGLSDGIYFLNIVADGKSASHKIVVKR